MEEREQNADVKALGFMNEFSKKFRSIEFTLHPSNIAGELAGKGSNMAWGARKLSERYSIGQRKDVIVTGIDGMWPCSFLLWSCRCRTVPFGHLQVVIR
jgi:hypothetical protein